MNMVFRNKTNNIYDRYSHHSRQRAACDLVMYMICKVASYGKIHRLRTTPVKFWWQTTPVLRIGRVVRRSTFQGHQGQQSARTHRQEKHVNRREANSLPTREVCLRRCVMRKQQKWNQFTCLLSNRFIESEHMCWAVNQKKRFSFL